MRSLNERFEARHAGALAGDPSAAFGEGELGFREQSAWWLRNSVGKLALDALLLGPSSLGESVLEHQTQIAACLARISALIDAASGAPEMPAEPG